MKRLSLIVLIISIGCSDFVRAEVWTKHQIYKKTRLCNGLNPADFNRDHEFYLEVRFITID